MMETEDQNDSVYHDATSRNLLGDLSVACAAQIAEEDVDNVDSIHEFPQVDTFEVHEEKVLLRARRVHACTLTGASSRE